MPNERYFDGGKNKAKSKNKAGNRIKSRDEKKERIFLSNEMTEPLSESF